MFGRWCQISEQKKNYEHNDRHNNTCDINGFQVVVSSIFDVHEQHIVFMVTCMDYYG